jgi:hypothetical protein
MKKMSLIEPKLYYEWIDINKRMFARDNDKNGIVFENECMKEKAFQKMLDNIDIPNEQTVNFLYIYMTGFH